MTIKERVLASMKTTYAKFGFKKEELNSLVDIISASMTEETTDEQISAALTANEPYAKMMQTVYNRGISETNKKFEGYVKPEPTPTPSPTPAPTPAPTPTGALTLEQVQQMIEKSKADNEKAIAEAVKAATAPFLEQQEKSRLSALLQNHDKLKSIPAKFRERYSLDKEENLDMVASQIESDYTALTQEQVSSGQFVEAPRQSSPESDADDFIKRMEDFGKRNAPEPQSSQK